MWIEILFRLVLLHGPDGQQIWVNPDTVTSIRTPRREEDHFPRGTKCIINMDDGKIAIVIESCDEVQRLGEK